MSRTTRNPLRLLYAWWRGDDSPKWKESRDRKCYRKAPGWYKRMKTRILRAKEREALAKGREPEKFRKTFDWDWN